MMSFNSTSDHLCLKVTSFLGPCSFVDVDNAVEQRQAGHSDGSYFNPTEAAWVVRLLWHVRCSTLRKQTFPALTRQHAACITRLVVSFAPLMSVSCWLVFLLSTLWAAPTCGRNQRSSAQGCGDNVLCSSAHSHYAAVTSIWCVHMPMLDDGWTGGWIGSAFLRPYAEVALECILHFVDRVLAVPVGRPGHLENPGPQR